MKAMEKFRAWWALPRGCKFGGHDWDKPKRTPLVLDTTGEIVGVVVDYGCRACPATKGHVAV